MAATFINFRPGEEVNIKEQYQKEYRWFDCKDVLTVVGEVDGVMQVEAEIGTYRWRYLVNIYHLEYSFRKRLEEFYDNNYIKPFSHSI